MTRFGFQEDQGVSGLWVVIATGHLPTQVVLSAPQVTGPVSGTAAEARQGGGPGRAIPEMTPTAVTPSVATELTITHLRNHTSPPEMVTLQFTREVPIRSVTVNFIKAAPGRQLMRLPPWCTRLTHFNHSLSAHSGTHQRA